MILQEPDRTAYDVRFHLFGVEVRIHPFFWIFSLLMSPTGDPKSALIWIAAVILSLLVHEFGHVLAFRRYGIRSSVVLHAFGGLAIPEGSGYSSSYGPRFSNGASAFIAFAGPAAEILSAVALLGAVHLSGHEVLFLRRGLLGFEAIPNLVAYPNVMEFVYFYGIISFVWGVINLLPIIPLDGGKISQALFLRIDPQTGLKQALILSILSAIFVGLFLVVQTGSLWNALLFAYLAYMNFQALQQLGFGGRRW
ncbi:MAG: hypothetical protein C0483_20030 [Pirellula sp.]|nr:hypothetical protein [Pirellula sp.]